MSISSACNLCQCETSTWYCRKDGIDVLRCPDCGLIYCVAMRDNEDMRKHYSKKYFEPYLKTESIHLKKRFSKRINEIKQYSFPGKLLDVGCGAGFFLKLAADVGYTVEGLELSSYAVQYAKQKFGLRVSLGDPVSADIKPQSFDIITLWHVLEHLRDPMAFLGQVNRLLKKDGLLAVEIPNIGSPMAYIAGMHWELMAPKEHFYYFNMHTISRYLADAGFAVMRIRTFYWTTPAMILGAYAREWKKPYCFLAHISAALASALWFIRFRNAPRVLPGDVLTIYAVKKREAS